MAVLLDASATLAYVLEEPGADVVGGHLAHASIASVNLVEVLTRLVDKGRPITLAIEAVEELHVHVIDVDRGIAFEAAELRMIGRPLGLSLADRICLATARLRGIPVLTADRAWAPLSPAIDVRMIR
jgi:PIN domain nuclease of toxin-antitoxin system